MSANIQERIDALDWNKAEEALSARGYTVTDPILTPEECASIVSLYHDSTRFRSQVIMERHRFGVGDYKYFANPLPEIVAHLRTSAYPHLARVANEWAKAFGEPKVFLLGQAGRDWEGGEFLLVEQQPRAQSKAEVVTANQGQGIIFTTRYRPVKGSRGYYRVNLRHGVSRVHRGTRYTLGIIFHDAK